MNKKDTVYNDDPRIIAEMILKIPGILNKNLCLTGDLGAGKTRITQEICSVLGVKEDVVSPTFTIINVYSFVDKTCGQSHTINHLDLYRLEERTELVEIGFYDIVNSDEFTIIEWANNFRSQIPEGAVWLELGFDSNGRRIVRLENEQ